MTTPEQLMNQYLKERAISAAYAKSAGLKVVDAKLAHALNFPYARESQGGIVVPYLNPLDHEPHASLMRVRYLGVLPIDNNGKPVRYAQPRGSDVEAFFDANVDWPKILSNPQVGIAITEGEAKALYMNQHRSELGVATIALGGVWNFRDKTTGDLTPWLRMVRAARSLSGGSYIIAFDSDMATNPDIQRAAEKLSQLLGIEVRGRQFLQGWR